MHLVSKYQSFEGLHYFMHVHVFTDLYRLGFNIQIFSNNCQYFFLKRIHWIRFNQKCSHVLVSFYVHMYYYTHYFIQCNVYIDRFVNVLFMTHFTYLFGILRVSRVLHLRFLLFINIVVYKHSATYPLLQCVGYISAIQHRFFCIVHVRALDFRLY